MKVTLENVNNMVVLLGQLWPKLTTHESRAEIENYIEGNDTAAFAHLAEGKCIGLALFSLRYDYVEGCDYSPVGYLEGIVVDENYRMKGVAKSLCLECESWAKTKGCKEFASDCEITNVNSLKFHLSLGFNEENRIICFKKNL